MQHNKVAPYGSWKSPFTADLVVAQTVWLGSLVLDGEDLYWIEVRPAEAGRYVIVKRTPDGQMTDVTPKPFSARTTVHEYGGGACVVADGMIYFSNYADQRLYRHEAGKEPRPITPAVDMRYADGVIDRQRGKMLCVREDHTVTGEPANTIVSLDLEKDEDAGEVIVGGNDFYSSPRLSPDAWRLAWLTWNHPNMPWDGNELWVGDLREDGTVKRARPVAGGRAESIIQPEWSPDGVLHFVSDRTNWWNLYRWRDDASPHVEQLCEMAADFGRPQWAFGYSMYAFESDRRILLAHTIHGTWHLGGLDTQTGKFKPIEIPYSEIWDLRAFPGHAVFIGGSSTEMNSIVQLELANGRTEVLHCSSEVRFDPDYLSVPQELEFPTENGLTAYAFLYLPKNRDHAGPRSELPPLIVSSHGGPTSAASTWLDANLAHIQFWTSRGFAVLDVNYGGSTGYGRAYRERLKGNVGVVDVNDCVNGARYLADHGYVDGKRLAIRGGSAGGYVTLAALTFHNVFKAGASYFGVADLEVWTKDTHKFESRYNDSLIGPYPERRDLYVNRSPINFIERISGSIILFQGLEDKIVPPSQAEIMFEAVRKKGLPVAYLAFEGEQHGFRKSETIKRALEAELYFYSKIFGFELADPVEPVHIENL